MIFTDDPVRRFEEFEKKDFARTDSNLGIEYENDEIFEDTVLLLRYNCPDEDCDVACLGWPDLHRHVKTKHGKVMWYVLILLSSIGTTRRLMHLFRPVIFAHETRKSLPMSMLSLRSPSCASMRSMVTTSRAPLTRADSRGTPSVASVGSAFMVMMSYMPIAETDTSAATSATAALPTVNSNTILTTMPLRIISKEIISFASIRNAWRKSSLSSSPIWISRRTK